MSALAALPNGAGARQSRSSARPGLRQFRVGLGPSRKGVLQRIEVSDARDVCDGAGVAECLAQVVPVGGLLTVAGTKDRCVLAFELGSVRQCLLVAHRTVEVLDVLLP